MSNTSATGGYLPPASTPAPLEGKLYSIFCKLGSSASPVFLATWCAHGGSQSLQTSPQKALTGWPLVSRPDLQTPLP